MSYLFAFSYCSWGSQAKNTDVVCHSLLQWTTFCQTSPPWPGRPGWPHTAWLSVTELDKAVVLVSDWLVFCDYGFRVSALWCPLATPTVLLVGFLLPRTWGVPSQLLQQSAAAAPYLGWGVASHSRPSWPWTWSSSSQHSCAPQHPLLGGGVAPLGRRPWPRRWGSSWPLLLHCRSLALSVGTPDFRRGVAPHGHASAQPVHFLSVSYIHIVQNPGLVILLSRLPASLGLILGGVHVQSQLRVTAAVLGCLLD